jgi:ketosteroid isomerase-like protein
MPPTRRLLPPDDPRAALIRRMQAAWNSGDLDGVVAGHHPDAVYVVIGGLESLVGREFHGHAAIRGFLEDFQASFGEVHIEIEQAITAGERVLLIIDQHTRGEAGGAETFNRWGQVLSFSQGMIVRAENYYEVDDALKAIREG